MQIDNKISRTFISLIAAGLGCLCLPGALFGQWQTSSGGIFYNGGNVGIHMSNPAVPLQIGTNMQASYFGDGSNNFVFSSFNGRAYFGYDNAGNAVVQGTIGKGIEFNTNNANFAQGTAMLLTPAGDLGIGTTTPRASLDVNGQIVATNRLTLAQDLASTGETWHLDNASGLLRLFWQPNIDTAGTVVMVANTAGNVGIGTTNPAYTLSVAGTVAARGFLTNTALSDYVFDKDYHLASLDEVGEYIKQNHHLPGIPSSAEAEKNGVEVGEMQAKLLAKVEELTLHMIQLENQNRELRDQVAQIRLRSDSRSPSQEVVTRAKTQ